VGSVLVARTKSVGSVLVARTRSVGSVLVARTKSVGSVLVATSGYWQLVIIKRLSQVQVLNWPVQVNLVCSN
jgi:hypothetical protein